MKSRNKIFYGVLIIILQVLLNSENAFAVYANPNPIRYKQPDGSIVTLHLKGDECFHWATTCDGYTVLQNSKGFCQYAKLGDNKMLISSGISANDSSNRNPSELTFLRTIQKGLFFSKDQIDEMKKSFYRGKTPNAPLVGGFPTTGTRNLIMILANFSNTATTYSQNDFSNYMNELNYNGTGSFRDYYIEVSYGKLIVNTIVTIWVTLPNTHDYYGPKGKWGEFALASITAANDQTSINFADFDNDNDGIVDGVAIVHQGQGWEETYNSMDIQSHYYQLSKWGFPETQRTFDGVLVDPYTTQPERNASGMSEIGVMCHEFGHNLGSPDFYDTDGPIGGNFDGTGMWDLMAVGSYNGVNGTKPAHPNAWIKDYFNWTNPIVLYTQQDILLRNAQIHPDVVRYLTTKTNEYFLCENRQQTGFDVGIPGHGLIIYHVDGDYISSHSADNDINAGSHQGLYPVCAAATGNPPQTYGMINSSGCSFPGSEGRTLFTDATIPDSHSWLGTNTNYPISNIIENISSKEISFNFNSTIFPELTQLEYFLDTDPGFGNGTPILAPAGSKSITQLFNIPMTNVSNGIHVLYVRAKNDDGRWGMTQNMPFYRVRTEIMSITAMEYFFDIDPGFGNGMPISVTAGSNNVITSLNIPLANVSNGIHALYIRAKNNFNQWSIVQTSAFYHAAAPLQSLSKLEYFFDSDPGPGNGISVALQNTSNETKSFIIDLSNVSNGIHTLYIRAKDLSNKWSLTSTIPFYRIPGITDKNITAVEFFIDQDPGRGLATQVPVYQPSPWFNQTFTVDLSCYTAGDHKLYLRAKDDQDRWSLTNIKSIAITVLPPAITVVGSTNLCQGEAVLLKVPKGIGRTYQWLRDNQLIAGATDSTYETTLAGYYRVVIDHNHVCQDTTAPVEVIVYPHSIGGLVTGSTRICKGLSTGVLNLISQSGVIQKWQKRWNGSNWTDIPNTNSTYSETPVFSGNWEYRAQVKNGPCPPEFSVPVTILVDTVSLAGQITGISIVNQGSMGIPYFVSPVGNATGYSWTLPTGSTISSGVNTNSILVDFSPYATSGLLLVRASNTCGFGPSSPGFNILVNMASQLQLSNLNLGAGDSFCFNALQTITVAGNGTTFTVQSGGSATIIAGQNIKYLPTTKVQAGGYMWGYIAPSGPWCQTLSMPALAMAQDEIPKSIQQSSFKVYPNPTTGNFILELTGGSTAESVRVDVYGIWGEKILSTNINGERKHEFSLSSNPPGMYFIRVTYGNKSETAKIVKK